MRVSFIRFNRAIQVNAARPGKTTVWHDDKESFNFFTVFTVGWETGARSRIRNLQTLQNVRAYLRKLYDGGWLSPTEYDKAILLVAEFNFID